MFLVQLAPLSLRALLLRLQHLCQSCLTRSLACTFYSYLSLLPRFLFFLRTTETPTKSKGPFSRSKALARQNPNMTGCEVSDFYNPAHKDKFDAGMAFTYERPNHPPPLKYVFLSHVICFDINYY